MTIGLMALAVGIAAGSPVVAFASQPVESAEPPCDATPCSTLKLRLMAQGERTPLQEARVIVIEAPEGAQVGPLDPPPPLPAAGPAWQRVGTTDDEGRVEIADVPRARVRVIVVAPGFDRFEMIVDPSAPSRREAKKGESALFVPPSEATAYRTVIVSDDSPPRAKPDSQVLTREEIRTLPGSQGDPLRALQNLPGVGRTPGNLGLLILRGASPDQSRAYMGGHALPRAFHVLSVASVFPAEVLDQLELVPGNFDSAYGNATGGIVVIEPRAGRRDGLHGFTELDIAAASTMLEGPLGKGSFIVGAQRGYADIALSLADRVQERVTGEPSTIIRPTYYDYQAMLDFPLRHGSWSVRAFGAGDRLRSAEALATPFTPSFDYRTSFHRFDGAVRARHDGWRFWWTPSFRFGRDRLDFSPSGSRQRRDDYVFSTRAEMSRRFSKRFSWLLGTDLEVDGFNARSRVVPLQFSNTPVAPPEEVTGVESNLGIYTSAQLDLGPVHVIPGARGNAFTTRDQARFSFDPRVTTHVDVARRWQLNFGVGKYSQARAVTETETISLLDQGEALGDGSVFYPPVFTRFDPSVSFAPGARQLTVREALHASAGAEVQLDRDIEVSATAFVREQDNATPVFFDGQVIDFASREHNVGVQALVRKRLTAKLYGWVAYTLMWSQLRFVETQPGPSPRDRPSDFDQRHNFNVVASYILPKNWRIGGRFRVVTGFPFSPVVGSVNVQGGRAAVAGRRNSGRLGTFHQLDLRIDKRWIRDRAIITGYVDVQNIYNRQNPEAVIYDANFRQQEGVVGIPIFPTLGIRVDY